MNRKLIIVVSILGGCYILKKVVEVTAKVGFLAGVVYTGAMLTKDFEERKLKRNKYAPTFLKRAEAEEVLTTLISTLEKYKVVSVADLKDIAGETPTFKDNKVGWIDLKDAVVIRVREGYTIQLPKPQELEDMKGE